jgi:hypothetical protein
MMPHLLSRHVFHVILVFYDGVPTRKRELLPLLLKPFELIPILITRNNHLLPRISSFPHHIFWWLFSEHPIPVYHVETTLIAWCDPLSIHTTLFDCCIASMSATLCFIFSHTWHTFAS